MEEKKQYVLKLFVVGKNPKSDNVIANIKNTCEEEFGDYDLNIIDVLDKPEIAISDKVIVTPTLIKELPEPVQRIVGDLSDKQRLMLVLDLA